MDSILCTNRTASLLLFYIVFTVPILSQLAYRLLCYLLRSYWPAYACASSEKQSKTARDFLKSIIYLIIVILLLPVSTRILKEWNRNGFAGPLPEFDIVYSRVVLSIAPAYYVFELVDGGADCFKWIHHLTAILGTPLVLSGGFLDSKDDVLYVTYASVLMVQVVLFGFVFFAGHGVARIWENSKRKYRMFYSMAAFSVVTKIGTQSAIWLRFAASVHTFSNAKPILITVAYSLGMLIADTHVPWVSYRMGRYVQNKVNNPKPKDALFEFTESGDTTDSTEPDDV